MAKSKEITYSEAPAQTHLASMLATKLPTNGEKHKTNDPSNSSIQQWGLVVFQSEGGRTARLVAIGLLAMLVVYGGISIS